MSNPDYLRLMDEDTIIARTICVTEAINVDLTFEDRIVGIENTNGLVDFGVLRFVLLHTPWVPMPPVEIELPEGYEYCTTDGQKRRHVSKNMRPVPHGRTGATLCGHYSFDQGIVDHRDTNPRRIDELPVCGGCMRTLKRLIG